MTRPRATVAFAQGAAELAGGATARLVVRRTGPAALGAASVKVTTAALGATAGADLAPVPTTLAFAPGERAEHVDLVALADREAEPDETFAVTLGDASGDAAVAAPATAAVTIRDVPARTSAPGTTPGGRWSDRTPPRISDVGLAPATFAVARRSTARAAARRGTTIRYTLSEPAAVVLRFQRAVGRGRHVTVGTLRRSARQGRNRVGFSGRIGRRTLRPGAHRLTISAVDAAGNRSAARPRRFRIVRQP